MSQIVFNSRKVPSLESQVENLQTTLAFLNQQVIILQEALQKKDQQIYNLETELKQAAQISGPETLLTLKPEEKTDQTLTLTEVLINLYKFIFPPGKVVG